MAAAGKRMILTKSRYTTGLQCEKRLWLELHEPDAAELKHGPDTQARFDTGNKVGEVARGYVPGGVLVERVAGDFLAPVKATAAAIAGGAAVVYEGAFFEDGIYCAVDILEKNGDAWTLIEVKSTVSVKPQHLADVAVQVHVARRAGLDVTRVEVMVLNSRCRFPELGDLFVRHDVTVAIEEHLRAVEETAGRLRLVIQSESAPAKSTGPHCYAPYECPFVERCHGTPPEHHVGTLYDVDASTAKDLEARGYKLVSDLDAEAGLRLSVIQARQVAAVRAGELIAEKALAKALAKLDGPIGYLDFETAAPAIPAWDGCGPYRGAPAQFSYHVESADSPTGHAHHGWVATGPGDPRRELAEALVAVCGGARMILSYHADFESRCVRELASRFPDLADRLLDINERIVDLLPLVRSHVYHPRFYGSFSLKAVLPALCPELGYDGLGIADGGAASRMLERILTEPESFAPGELEKAVADLREYCRLDTWAMVRLVECLRALVGMVSGSR